MRGQQRSLRDEQLSESPHGNHHGGPLPPGMLDADQMIAAISRGYDVLALALEAERHSKSSSLARATP
jgi:hypothetical protein